MSCPVKLTIAFGNSVCTRTYKFIDFVIDTIANRAKREFKSKRNIRQKISNLIYTKSKDLVTWGLSKDPSSTFAITREIAMRLIQELEVEKPIESIDLLYRFFSLGHLYDMLISGVYFRTKGRTKPH